MMNQHLFEMFLSLIFLLSQCGEVTAFWRHLCYGELGTARVDPLMSPGHVSQHAHVAFGSSAFGFDPTIEQLMVPNCTSCSIVEDKSVYWTPRMYFEHVNGTFEMVPTSGGMTAYYFSERPNTGEEITPFPKNFRMIAGNSVKRAFYGLVPDPPMSEWNTSDTTQQALMEKSIGFNCLHYANPPNEGSLAHHYMRPKSFIDSNCPNGIRAELQFPSCWNGRDLDSHNHSVHVAYPNELRNGNCPEGFPVRLPVLFFETVYTTSLFSQYDGQFVFANGDPTGYGYHGDFICGWEDGILEAAVNNPYCTNIDPKIQNNGTQEECPVFNIKQQDEQTTCHMTIPTELENEQIDFIPQLPGKIPIQSGPAPAIMPGMNNTILSFESMIGTKSLESSNPQSPYQISTATKSAEDISSTETTTTTMFLGNGVQIDLVIVEEIITTTVTTVLKPPVRHAHGTTRKHSGHFRHL